MGVAMQGLSKIFRAPIIKVIGYRAHRAVIFAIAWHLVFPVRFVTERTNRNLPSRNMLVQLLALYTDRESHNVQRFRQTNRRQDDANSRS